ncbi:MAG TPA: MBL fold metallo-hydrolase [Terriglobales bacterium]
MPYIQFLGAAGGVTGSKHLINTGRTQVLIDCGLFQGQKSWREHNWQPLPIPVADIDAVVLTHAHLDHSGWIPRLVKDGFKGPIYATPATIELCGILLPDSGHLQEEDAAFHNKHNTSKHEPALPLYNLEDAQNALHYFQPVDFNTPQKIGDDFEFRFVPAAHIVGSSMAEISTGGKQLLFTGDIGRVRSTTATPGKLSPNGPQTSESCDVLVMESTYGNRLHPTADVRPQMAACITKTVKRGGSVIIPAFAVERTQKLLFLLKDMMESGQIPRIPIHVDSPMAIKAIQVFLKHSEDFTPETKALIAKYGSPLQWPGVSFDSTKEESKRINDTTYPQIIVSSSGMITGGRILHHLIRRLPDPRNTVVFIGFQAPGTRGALLKAGANSIKMFGQVVPVRAEIVAFEQFSDHADTPELLEWLKTFKAAPQVTYLVHGEPAAAEALCDAIEEQMHWNVRVAEWLQKVEY